MTDMDTHDEAAAADFEQGWSGERIAAARRAWGLAVSDGLPVWLNRQLAERAHAEGRSELGIIQEALTRYFTSEGVEVMDTIWKVGRPTKWSPIVRSRLRRVSGCSRFRLSGRLDRR